MRYCHRNSDACYDVIYYHIISYRVVSCHTAYCRVLPYRTVLCYTVSFPFFCVCVLRYRITPGSPKAKKKKKRKK